MNFVQLRWKRKVSRKLKYAATLILLIVYGTLLSEGKGRSGGGKTVAKSALSGLSKLSMASGGSFQTLNTDRTSGSFRTSTSKSVLYNLTRQLLHGYDSGIRPVHNDYDRITVEVDVLYRQVLDMDEKNQVLTSLVWYRQHWQDMFLKWDPLHFANISEIWLSSDAVWMPDIVLQEETGSKDYSPRLPFVKVSCDGHVEYNEPLPLTTSCSMNTMHFPFDVQHCGLTFSSWSLPGSKLRLMSERNTGQMQKDIHFFINTGEWRLEEINVKEMSANYSEIMVESVVDYSAWPQVLFVMTLRRNSSFYVQSMIFPSVLLTSIALLGFFLPPDSGERVGLQITILLTFMVFLLTVCEMFPASTGPYLGTYYVICTFLLAVNLLMTVIVLRLYYHPSRPINQSLKYFTYMAGKIFCVDVRELEVGGIAGIAEESSKSLLNKFQKAKTEKLHRCFSKLCCSGEEATTSEYSSKLNDEDFDSIKKRRLYSSPPTPHFARSKSQYMQSNGAEQKQKNNRRVDTESPLSFRRRYQTPSNASFHRRSIPTDRLSYYGSDAQDELIMSYGNSNVYPIDIKSNNNIDATSPSNDDELKQVNTKLAEIVKLFTYIATDMTIKNKDVEYDNEWKNIALVMDRLFLRLYFTILVISHVTILAMAVITMYTIEDPFHSLPTNPPQQAA